MTRTNQSPSRSYANEHFLQSEMNRHEPSRRCVGTVFPFCGAAAKPSSTAESDAVCPARRLGHVESRILRARPVTTWTHLVGQTQDSDAGQP